MKCVIYSDNTLPMAIESFADVLNRTCRAVSFKAGSTALRISRSHLSYPSSYEQLPSDLLAETAEFDLAFLCTNVPYDNNHFFNYAEREVLVSFSGWNLLTDLSVTNGLAYFIASIICEQREIGQTHQENIGCINDFWWDKRGIDVGMRAAFLCRKCRASYKGDPVILADVEAILDLVCLASRQGRDLLSTAPRASVTEEHFDVFLCHNTLDKPAVRMFDQELRAAGVKTWLDEEQLPPGLPWQPRLEEQMELVRAACVLTGENGFGPWQDIEMRSFLSEFVRRGCPVIPVVLPAAKVIPELPLFLRQMTWIDLRDNYGQNFERLARALKRN